MAQLGSGQRVADRYEVRSILATGGMAEVFLATDLAAPAGSPPVVLKRILPQLALRQGFARMFGDEARLALRLRHENIARVEDVVVHEGLPLLVMEYVEGISFLDWILATRRRRLRLDLLLEALRQVCLGLDYAHGLADEAGQPLGIVHRDVSPQNLLIGEQGLVKIIDFGVAKAATRSDRTEAGVLKGKFPYMAPERVQGLAEDRRSDLFSLGVVAFEMTSRKRLFWRESDYQTLHAIASEAVPRLGRVAPGTPPELDAIVMRALEKRPEDRFQTGSEMAEAIARAGRDLGLVLAREPLAALAREVARAATGVGRVAPEGPNPVSRAMTLPYFFGSEGEWREGTEVDGEPTLEETPSAEVLECGLAFEPTDPGERPAPLAGPAAPRPVEREDSLRAWQQRAQAAAGPGDPPPDRAPPAHGLPALPPVPEPGPPPETMAGSFGYALAVLRMVRARRAAMARLEAEARNLERQRGELLRQAGARLRGQAEAVDRRLAARIVQEEEATGSPAGRTERLAKLHADLGRAAWTAGAGRDRAADLFRSLDRCQQGIDACRAAVRRQALARREFERRPVAVAILAIAVPLVGAGALLALLAMSGAI